jgi:hypothetical protein
VWASALAAMSLGLAPAAVAADDVVDHAVQLTIADPAIHESSGLADTGSLVLTVNDSGSEPLLYALDARTGRTVSATPYTTGEAEDTEALALGRQGRVWVGDIGDNLGVRDTISVYDVRPGRAGGRRFELTYPDGPRDAEALLAHPGTDRVFVVSKGVFGGVVYAGPRTPTRSQPNLMTRFAQVSGLVTGGEFLPDVRHVVLRTYGTASVYTFPGFELRGTVRLPEQEQGEALSVGRRGRVLVSTEGVRADVLRVDMRRALTGATEISPRQSPVPDPTAGTVGAREPGEAAPGREGSGAGVRAREVLPVAAGAALVTALVAALVVALGRRRPRGWRRGRSR